MNNATSSLDFAKRLIAFDTVSRGSNEAVTDEIAQLLDDFGFDIERVDYDDAHGVRKSCVVGKKGQGQGGAAYFGHTDVVPADDWKFAPSGPFEPTVVEQRLYGRGSCDMKGSIACALAAASQQAEAEFAQPLYFACTADEEIGYEGARQVAEHSKFYREMVEHNTLVLIGEPTELRVVHAHKGTYGFRAISRGESAHSSTAEGLNANLAMIPFLVEMKAIHDETESQERWKNHEFSPPTMGWNIGVNDHTFAINIKPPQSVCTVYFRPMPGVDGGPLLERARSAAERCGIEFTVERCAEAVYVDSDADHIQELVELAGTAPASTVSYGTDGAMLRDLKRIAVVGPGSIDQAHTCDEWIDLKQLALGAEFYQRVIQKWCMAPVGAP
jgi:acetylornithine deacetylase